jgi:hypothetical protein
MVDEMRLPIFRGDGSEDPDQHWFLCEVVWSIKKVSGEYVKRAQFSTNLRDRTLSWYMKFVKGTVQPKPLNNIKTDVECRIQETQVIVAVHYITEINQAESSSTCLGV